MVMDSLTSASQTSASQGPTGDSFSPELVLVSPDLWVEALLRLPSPESFAAARAVPTLPSLDDVGEPAAASAWQDLLGRVEVSAQVPVLLMVALFAAVAMLRVMVVIGVPVVMIVAVAALLGS
jgi:hypothetical protein